MKPWTLSREKVADIRVDIARFWTGVSDSTIGQRHGVSRFYVAKLRKRMGIHKSLGVIRNIKDSPTYIAKNKPATVISTSNRRHRRMSEAERFERAFARSKRRSKTEAGIKQVTQQEQGAMMTSKGYGEPKDGW